MSSKPDDTPSLRSRSVSIGGDAKGNQIITGDNNTAHLTWVQSGNFAPSKDPVADLRALKEVLLGLQDVDQAKIETALKPAEEDLAGKEPDKSYIGGIIKHVLDVAKKASDFGDHAEKIKERLGPLLVWLGAATPSLTGII